MRLTDTQTATLRALVELGGARLSDLSERLGVTPASLKDRLEGLKKKGAAEVRGKAWHATAEGVAALPVLLPAETPQSDELQPEAGQPEPAHRGPLSAHPGWAALTSALPLPELRALLRVLSAVALLRQTAPALGQMPWVGAYGPPGTGKTTVGEVALHLFGGELFKVGTMTAGEAVGRRVQVPGGGFEVTPPRTIRGPVTVLDELSEAQGGLERAFFALVELGPVVRIEGQELPQRAAVFMTWNPEGREIPLPPGAPRRGVLLDTTRRAARLTRAFTVEGAAARVRAVLDQHPAPWCALSAFQVQPVDPALVNEGRTVLYGLATPEGRAALPFGALEGLAAAYGALLDLSPVQAVAEVVADVALLAASREGLVSGPWEKAVGELRARASLPALDVDRESDERQETRREALALLTERSGYRKRLQERVKVQREGLQKVPGGQLEERERVARADLLGRLETVAERLPHMPDEGLEDADGLLDELDRARLALAYKISGRLAAERERLGGEVHELAARYAEAQEGGKQAGKQARDWEAAARKLRQAGDTERALSLLAGWGYVQEREASRLPVESHQGGQTEPFSRRTAGQAALHFAGGLALIYLERSSGVPLRSRRPERAKPAPVRYWTDKQGQHIPDPAAYVAQMVRTFEQHAQQERGRAASREQEAQRLGQQLTETRQAVRALGNTSSRRQNVLGRGTE